jgi:hypothetical protein
VEAQRRHLEIFAPEQIGVGGEEDDDAEADQEDERQRHQIDCQHQQRELDRHQDRAAERHGAAGRLAGIVGALHDFGHLVEEESGEEGGCRRDEEG